MVAPAHAIELAARTRFEIDQPALSWVQAQPALRTQYLNLMTPSVQAAYALLPNSLTGLVY